MRVFHSSHRCPACQTTSTCSSSQPCWLGISALLLPTLHASQVVYVSDHDHLLFFTSEGRAYCMRAFDVPEGSRTSIGTAFTQASTAWWAVQALCGWIPSASDLFSCICPSICSISTAPRCPPPTCPLLSYTPRLRFPQVLKGLNKSTRITAVIPVSDFGTEPDSAAADRDLVLMSR